MEKNKFSKDGRDSATHIDLNNLIIDEILYMQVSDSEHKITGGTQDEKENQKEMAKAARQIFCAK